MVASRRLLRAQGDRASASAGVISLSRTFAFATGISPVTSFPSVAPCRPRGAGSHSAPSSAITDPTRVWLPAVEAPNYHTIHYNWFGPRPPPGENGGETIRVGDSGTSMQSSRTLVEDNYFEQCNGEIEIISNKSCDNSYRSNTFEDCEGALTLRHGNRCLVEGNFFLGNGRRSTGCVRIVGEDHRVVNNYLERLTGAGSRERAPKTRAATRCRASRGRGGGGAEAISDLHGLAARGRSRRLPKLGTVTTFRQR